MEAEHRFRRSRWSGVWTIRASLTGRILAVNIIALGLMAASLFYIDSYRKQLLAERFNLAEAEALIAADALAAAPPRQRGNLLAAIGTERKLRLRYYNPKGKMVADSFAIAGPAFTLADPADDPWYARAARAIDRGMDFVLGAPPVPDYNDPGDAGAEAWPELVEARATGKTIVMQRYAPDRTPVITATVPVGTKGEQLLLLRNSPDITQAVRDARQNLAIVVAVALLVSVQLSLFLARTIVKPLRQLVRAAIRVRLGRDREVVVPRLPDRRDEIGLLARAVSDMTTALRQRIDAVESFAADVAHEIKNPLASLRSAVESLDKVDDPALRRQLTAIAAHDVQRIDRLVSEIAEASRIDAELSRTTFEPVDLVALVRALATARDERGENGGHPIEVAHYGDEPVVLGEAARLERVIENLLDNAVSFSPDAASIEVEIAGHEGVVELAVSDHGPGIAPEVREKVFERFHSLRPAGEDFGSHSGLGLAIARTIVEAHDGMLSARDRLDGGTGARMVVELPALEPA
ncbi:MAG: HAMP domain-containing sensor histidine kinase [Novosphingobium sp.]